MRRLLAFVMIVFGAVYTAYATPVQENSFPGTGMMQENRSYLNQANETNIVGLDGGNVTAQANYDWVEVTLTAGQYLPQSTTIDGVTTCTAGNFCSGGTTVHYDNTQAQGITSCSTATGGLFTNSASGSTANTDCYRTCDINNMTTISNPNGTIANIAHATQLTGNDYYGNGTDTCEPATCETGYQVSPGTQGALATCVPKTYNITWADTLPADVTVNEAATATYGGNINTPVKINPAVFQTTQKGKRFIGWTFGAPKYDFSTLDPSIDGNTFTYSAANQTWATTFNYGMVSGVSLCSVTPGQFVADTGIPDTTTTGEEAYYCWCKATGYTSAGENTVYENTSSSPWVFYNVYGSASSCASGCASSCGYYVRGYSGFRGSVFGITNN